MPPADSGGGKCLEVGDEDYPLDLLFHHSCRKKNELVAEYALRGLDQSIAVAAWQTHLTETCPKTRSSLPSVRVSRSLLGWRYPLLFCRLGGRLHPRCTFVDEQAVEQLGLRIANVAEPVDSTADVVVRLTGCDPPGGLAFNQELNCSLDDRADALARMRMHRYSAKWLNGDRQQDEFLLVVTSHRTDHDRLRGVQRLGRG
jgi:hypothetical protein